MDQVKAKLPGAMFFVASNCENTKDAFVSRFGKGTVVAINNRHLNDVKDRLLHLPAQARTTARGMQRALVDFLILARSALLVHSYGSSFGEEAAAVHETVSIRIRVGGNILGADASSRFCNNALIENARSEENQQHTDMGMNCFVEEGSSHQYCTPLVRVLTLFLLCIDTAFVWLQVSRTLCHRMEISWGISDVYC